MIINSFNWNEPTQYITLFLSIILNKSEDFHYLLTTKGNNLEAKNASMKAIPHVFIHDLRNKAVYPTFIETMTKEIMLDMPKIIKILKINGSNFY